MTFPDWILAVLLALFLAAGSPQAAIDSVNQDLSTAGRQGKHYREALELLVKAERGLPEPTADRAESRGAESDIVQQPQAVSPTRTRGIICKERSCILRPWATRIHLNPAGQANEKHLDPPAFFSPFALHLGQDL